MEDVGPGLAGDGIDLAGRDPHGERICVRGLKGDPHRLGLPHGHENAATLDDRRRQAGSEIIGVAELEAAMARWQRIGSAIVRQAQCSLEMERAMRLLVHLGKAETKVHTLKGDHLVLRFLSSPIAVSHLPHDAQDGVVRHFLHLTDELGKKLGPLANNLLEVARHLACEGQEDVGILAEIRSDPPRRLLRWRCEFAALQLAQISRLDPGSRSNLAKRVTAILSAPLLAQCANVIAERRHV